MICAKIKDLFSDYYERSLPNNLIKEIDSHMAGCDECKESYDNFQTAVTILDELPEVNITDGFHQAVMNRLESSRRAAPKRVEWWKIEWDKVFTLQIPAKAVIMGLGLLLIVIVLSNIAPMSTVTAGFFSPRQSTSAPVGIVDNQDLKSWGPWGTRFDEMNRNVSGVSVYAAWNDSSKGDNNYIIQLSSRSKQPVGVVIYILNDDYIPMHNINVGETFYKGFVAKGQNALVQLNANENQSATVAIIAWTYGGKDFKTYVFLPKHFDPRADMKNEDISWHGNGFLNTVKKECSIYQAMKSVSGVYGVILLTSGDLTQHVVNISLKNVTPEVALNEFSQDSNLKWREIEPSIYEFKPLK